MRAPSCTLQGVQDESYILSLLFYVGRITLTYVRASAFIVPFLTLRFHQSCASTSITPQRFTCFFSSIFSSFSAMLSLCEVFKVLFFCVAVCSGIIYPFAFRFASRHAQGLSTHSHSVFASRYARELSAHSHFALQKIEAHVSQQALQNETHNNLARMSFSVIQSACSLSCAGCVSRSSRSHSCSFSSALHRFASVSLGNSRLLFSPLIPRHL